VSKKAKDASADSTEPLDLEKSLAELEKIVARMESGEISLDESLKLFERGVALTRQCQTALKNAEQKVEILLRKSDGYEVAPFEGEGSSDVSSDA